MLCDSICMKYSELGKYRDQIEISGCLGMEEGEMGSNCQGVGSFFMVMKIFQNYIMLRIVQLCKYTENHEIVRFQ